MGSGSFRLAQITGPAKDNGKGGRASTRNFSKLQGQSLSCQPQVKPADRSADSHGNLTFPPASEAILKIMAAQRTWIMRAIKPIERLVPVSSTRRRAYTPGLSTWSSSTALIGSTRFKGGFPLRCLQRLSRPYIAMLHCGWRHNSSTRGTSIPVLSY